MCSPDIPATVVGAPWSGSVAGVGLSILAPPLLGLGLQERPKYEILTKMFNPGQPSQLSDYSHHTGIFRGYNTTRILIKSCIPSTGKWIWFKLPFKICPLHNMAPFPSKK